MFEKEMNKQLTKDIGKKLKINNNIYSVVQSRNH